MEDSQKKNNARRITWMWLTFQSQRIQEIRIYYSKKRKERHFQRYHYDYSVRTISYNLWEWKKERRDSKTVVCSGFFTFDENPYVDPLNVIHFWLSFWLRCFADCRFVSIGDCVKIAGKKIKLRRCRSRRRKRKRIERKTARVTETGWERTRTHLLVRRAERDWGGRQIRGDSTLGLPSS